LINAAVEPGKTTNRTFATFDLFPSTLAAMGVKIEGDRLGLGTNLFSSKKTLAEEYGYKELDYELLKESPFYNKTFLKTKY
jgi:phosphoglycerol transferase